MMKYTFYFVLKALFVLKIFKFLSRGQKKKKKKMVSALAGEENPAGGEFILVLSMCISKVLIRPYLTLVVFFDDQDSLVN